MTTVQFDFDKHIAYLRDAQGVPVVWTVGKHLDGSPDYDQEMYQFASEFQHSTMYNQDYDRVLSKLPYDKLEERDIEKLIVESDDVEVFDAITSAIIRGERHLEGMWAAMLQNGLLLRLVEKLQAIHQG